MEGRQKESEGGKEGWKRKKKDEERLPGRGCDSGRMRGQRRGMGRIRGREGGKEWVETRREQARGRKM